MLRFLPMDTSLPEEPAPEVLQTRILAEVDREAKYLTFTLAGEEYGIGIPIKIGGNLKCSRNGKYVIGYEITTPYIEKAIAGKSDRAVFTDSAGNLTMVAFNPLGIEGLNWACVSKMNLEEAIEETSKIIKTIDEIAFAKADAQGHTCVRCPSSPCGLP
jgi:hypothetical protein